MVGINANLKAVLRKLANMNDNTKKRNGVKHAKMNGKAKKSSSEKPNHKGCSLDLLKKLLVGFICGVMTGLAAEKGGGELL